MTRSFAVLAAFAILTACGSPTSSSSGWQPAPVKPLLQTSSDTPFVALPWDGGVATMGAHIYEDSTPATSLWIQPVGGTGFSLSIGSEFIGMGWAASPDRLLIVGTWNISPPSTWSNVWTGSAWSSVVVDNGVGQYGNCAVWTGSRFVLAGQTGSAPSFAVWTSGDGEMWTKAVMTGTPTWGGVIAAMAANGSTVVGLTNSADTWVSNNNGQTWTLNFIDTSSWGAQWLTASEVNLDGIAFGNGVWVAVGHNTNTGEALIAVSNDGTSWQPVTFPVTGALTSVAFGNDEFVTGFGSGETVQFYSSRDGVTWTPRPVLAPTASPSVGRIDFVGGTFYWANSNS